MNKEEDDNSCSSLDYDFDDDDFNDDEDDDYNYDPDVHAQKEMQQYTPSAFRIQSNKAKHMELGTILALYFEAVYSEQILPHDLLEDNTTTHFHIPDQK